MPSSLVPKWKDSLTTRLENRDNRLGQDPAIRKRRHALDDEDNNDDGSAIIATDEDEEDALPRARSTRKTRRSFSRVGDLRVNHFKASKWRVKMASSLYIRQQAPWLFRLLSVIISFATKRREWRC